MKPASEYFCFGVRVKRVKYYYDDDEGICERRNVGTVVQEQRHQVEGIGIQEHERPLGE